MLCLQGRRTLVILVLGRREETHRLHYSLRRRRVRRLHRRLTVLSLCIESRCVRRVTPGYRRRRTSPHPLPGALSAESTVVSEDPRYSCSGSTRGNTSLALFPPTPEGTSSSSPVDRSQPLHRESLRCYVCDSSYVAVSLTMRYISGVNRCVVFTGSEDPCCSCSWSTRGSTPFALFPPTPEYMSSSSPVESSQPVRRELLRPSSDTCLVQPPDVILPLTTRYVNAVGRGSVFRSRRRTHDCSCSFTNARGHIGCPVSTKIRRSGRCIQADETRPSAVAEETPTSELLPCLLMQLSVNTGCRIRYVLSTYDDGLLFQYNTTG